MRQHTMAEAITTLGPEAASLVAEIGESFHLSLPAWLIELHDKVPVRTTTDNTSGLADKRIVGLRRGTIGTPYRRTAPGNQQRPLQQRLNPSFWTIFHL
jgi:hypothetical protein